MKPFMFLILSFLTSCNNLDETQMENLDSIQFLKVNLNEFIKYDKINRLSIQVPVDYQETVSAEFCDSMFPPCHFNPKTSKFSWEEEVEEFKKFKINKMDKFFIFSMKHKTELKYVALISSKSFRNEKQVFVSSNKAVIKLVYKPKVNIQKVSDEVWTKILHSFQLN